MNGRHVLLVAIAACGALPVHAQQVARDPAAAAAPALTVEPSGRGRTAVTLRRGRTPLELSIDYGTPVLRGRAVDALAPAGGVWRLGANTSTTLKTAVDLMIGGAHVPPGTYSLFAVPGPTGWTLVVNKQSGQWGTQYDQAQDLVRIPMRVRRSSTPVEAFTMWLVPDQGAARGKLILAWGNVEASTDWIAH